MLRSVTIIFFVLSFVPMYAQDTLNHTDEQGRKQGFWQKTDSLGNLFYTGRFLNNKPTGEFKYYYPNGKIKIISQFSDNGEKSTATMFYNNGLKMASGIYMNEKRDSIWSFFNEYDGGLVSTETYKKGIKDGLSKLFNPDRSLSELIYYKNGLKSGLWEQYFLDGKLKVHGAYINGDKQGPFKIFFNSGQVMISGQYKSGHQDGVWLYYDDSGTLIRKEIFNLGILIKTEEGPVKK